MLGHGQLDYAAEARLISDNLLDFSHISFVHAQSFDLGSQFAEIRAKITPLERGIRYERWMENFAKNAASQDDAPADSYMTYDYLLPGILLLRVTTLSLARALIGMKYPSRRPVPAGNAENSSRIRSKTPRS